MIDWKGNELSRMDFTAATEEYGSPFWDFHRADLHSALLDRARELGASSQIDARVEDVRCHDDTVTVVLRNGQTLEADLVVGADGIFSRCRDILVGKPDPPIPTGDLAYRLLLNTDEMAKDPELAPFLDTPHVVRYWLGPGAHAVNYVLRNGKLFNMVLLVPDDMPADATTLDGNVEEMRALYKDWDPRIPKLLNLCQSVQKWKLCYRPGLATSWSHPSGTFTLLGDAVHATLPYLASGAGMSLEDGACLGHCLAKVKGRLSREKKLALAVYEKSRRLRTESIVERGNLQQLLYHFDDGEEQRRRDELFRRFERLEHDRQECTRNFKDFKLPDGLQPGDDPLAWRRYGVGRWLMRFDCQADVESLWPTTVEAKM
jgi:salicylate hydroxylase